MEVIIKSRAGGKMTIEEKVSNIILETMKEQTDFCKKTALGNKATLAEQKAIFDQATQAILDLIKPMSGILQADEVTLAFFRKSLEMPDGTLEDLCREIIRLRAIKPISREDILKAIERVRWTRAAKAFEDTNSRFEYDLADSLLELINGKEA